MKPISIDGRRTRYNSWTIVSAFIFHNLAFTFNYCSNIISVLLEFEDVWLFFLNSCLRFFIPLMIVKWNRFWLKLIKKNQFKSPLKYDIDWKRCDETSVDVFASFLNPLHNYCWLIGQLLFIMCSFDELAENYLFKTYQDINEQSTTSNE